jgi:hypothetical protein
MKNVFLMITVPVLLVTLGFAQTPAPIMGCLGGSDGNYTVAEDGTTQIYKITSSTVDLKPHVGHDIAFTGQTTTATSSGPSDNSIAVTGVNMISDHCATPTASTATVADTTPTASAGTPVVADTTRVATASTPAVVAPSTAPDPAPTQTASAPMTATASAPDNTEALPNTATSLPLLGLLGLGLVGLGLLSRRLRTNSTVKL